MYQDKAGWQIVLDQTKAFYMRAKQHGYGSDQQNRHPTVQDAAPGVDATAVSQSAASVSTAPDVETASVDMAAVSQSAASASTAPGVVSTRMRAPESWELTMETSNEHTKIRYAEQDWEYLDTYVGGEPYAGCTEISHNGKVIFSMIYCGEIFAGCDTKAVQSCLVEALLSPQATQMWRGPAFYASADGELMYICDVRKLETSELDTNAFRLYEYIVHRQTSVKLYEATFTGMMVDRR